MKQAYLVFELLLMKYTNGSKDFIPISGEVLKENYVIHPYVLARVLSKGRTSPYNYSVSSVSVKAFYN